MTKNDILEYFKDINFMYNEATRFDSLKNMLDELEIGTQEQGWISVKDRLPDEDEDVLAYNGTYLFIAAYTTNPTKYWYTISGSTIYPTHWMPLPEPPKEENPL